MRIRTPLRDWKPRKSEPEGKTVKVHNPKKEYSRKNYDPLKEIENDRV